MMRWRRGRAPARVRALEAVRAVSAMNEVMSTLESVSSEVLRVQDRLSVLNARLTAREEWSEGLQTTAQETMALAVSRILDAIGPVAQEVNGSYNTSLAILGEIKALAAQVGPIANEVNGTLNMVATHGTAQGAMVEALGRIEARLAADNEHVTALGLLVARGIASLLGRPAERLIVQHAIDVPPIAAQLKQLEANAPNNFAHWHDAYTRGTAAGERSVFGTYSHEGHAGAGHFRMFIDVHARGRLLDFGCGPLSMPSYLDDWPHDQLAGFDPQPPFEPQPFAFGISLGEWIPWPDASFETVVIATSLDHVYLLDQALEEVKRVLVPDGRLLIWTAMFPETPPYDPYGPTIVPPDAYHLFHPGRNWFYDLFSADYDLIERMEAVSQSEMLAYRRRTAKP